MTQRPPFALFSWSLMAVSLCWSAPAWAAERYERPIIIATAYPLLAGTKASAGSEREAAQLATQRHGGKVLRVQRQGDHFEVRLLLDNGRVKHVNIPASDKSGKS